MAEQIGGIPTLHHLDNSRSQRVLWLLEELGIEYKLVLYKRQKDQRAPPELAEVQQLGKSPILVTPQGRPIAESAAIMGYLLRTFDYSGKFASTDLVSDEMLTAFSEGNLVPLMITELAFEFIGSQTPWPLSYLPRLIRKGIANNYTRPEIRKDLKFLSTELGDKNWFNGEQPGRSDFMLTFSIDVMAERKWFDFSKEYPQIDAWRQRILAREAWKRGLEKGNGYNPAGS